VILPVAALSGLLPLAPAQAPPPVFRLEVEAVRVDVAVTRRGEAVRGLTVRDFELRDEGVRQDLEAVLEEKDVPLEAWLVLDLSASVSGQRLFALRRAALAFLDGLRPGDQAALLCFSHQVALRQPLTADLDRVRNVAVAVQGTGSTALRDAVYAALVSRGPTRNRSAIVVFSDGVDNLSWLSPQAVEEAARRADATVYAVVISPGDPRAPTTQPFLTRLAGATGGRVWTARRDRDLRSTFLDLLRHVRGRYVLTYAPLGVPKRGWHRLEVKLKGRKGDVLARPGYWRAERSAGAVSQRP
jgi:VWFA-related protein